MGVRMWQEVRLSVNEFEALYDVLESDDDMRRDFVRAACSGPSERRGITAYWVDVSRYHLKRLLELAKVYAPTAESAIGATMEADGRILV
jgi:hypothetical protein